MSYGVAESELLAKDAVLRRMQGAMGYKFWTGVGVKNKVKGEP
jgi:hypothetical protein